MELEWELLDQWNITEYNLLKQFVSKKNRVHLVRALLQNGSRQSFVVKEYRSGSYSIQREAEMLEGLHKNGISVPRLYYKGKRSIVMEYIKGPTLIDVLTDAEYMTGQSFDYANSKGVASHLARWFDMFYKAARSINDENTILWDINLRNFLLDFKLYGIDFEDCREGVVEEDMGRLMAFIVTYQPAFTPYKMQFAREVYDAMNDRMLLDRDRVMAEVLKEFEAIRVRRSMDIPESIATEIMP